MTVTDHRSLFNERSSSIGYLLERNRLRTAIRFTLLVLLPLDKPIEKSRVATTRLFNDNHIHPVLVLHCSRVPCLRQRLHGAICVKCIFTRYGDQFVGEVDFAGRYTR